MDITLVITRRITGNPCIIIKSIDNLFFLVKNRLFSRLCSLKFIFKGSILGSLARSRLGFFMETKKQLDTRNKEKSQVERYPEIGLFFLPLLCHLCKTKRVM